ncbi:MAG: hypothetical protein M1828_000124 [Chrysothrix sp. TS-e1954]|nr:MAG: hypothetical protein M1828_000124 [Chrysothrix sp. TS-e1954]
MDPDMVVPDDFGGLLRECRFCGRGDPLPAMSRHAMMPPPRMDLPMTRRGSRYPMQHPPMSMGMGMDTEYDDEYSMIARRPRLPAMGGFGRCLWCRVVADYMPLILKCSLRHELVGACIEVHRVFAKPNALTSPSRRYQAQDRLNYMANMLEASAALQMRHDSWKLRAASELRMLARELEHHGGMSGHVPSQAIARSRGFGGLGDSDYYPSRLTTQRFDSMHPHNSLAFPGRHSMRLGASPQSLPWNSLGIGSPFPRRLITHDY